MEIIALQEYTDNKISLYEGEIRNINNSLAQKLIEEGIVAEHGDSEGDSGNNSELIVYYFEIAGDPVCSHSLDQIIQALNTGKTVYVEIVHGNGTYGKDIRLYLSQFFREQSQETFPGQTTTTGEFASDSKLTFSNIIMYNSSSARLYTFEITRTLGADYDSYSYGFKNIALT